jgi:ATP-dependent Clp protease ATP-binding subunit ClpA
MTKFLSQNRKTILGYHNKSINKIGILDKEKLPILTEEDYSTFLTTRDHLFSIQTKQIVDMIKEQSASRSVSTILNSIMIFTAIPGIISALIFIIKKLTSLALPDIADRFLLQLFSISLIAIIILLHKAFGKISKEIRLPFAPMIPEKELTQIKNSGFPFARFIKLDTVSFCSDSLRDFLANNSKKGSYQSLEAFMALGSNKHIKRIIRRANLQIEQTDMEIENLNSSTVPTYPVSALRSLLTYALEEALLSESREIDIPHLFIAYFKLFPVLRHHLEIQGLSVDLLREIVNYYEQRRQNAQRIKFLNPNNPYYKTPGIGDYWIYGYTFILSKFSKDLNEKMAYEPSRFGIGHDREIEEIISIVSRLSKKNVLLIGDPGTGKSSIIKGLAQNIILGKVPSQMAGKRIIQLDITSLLAQGINDNLEQLINRAMHELSKAGNTILYIDEIQEIIPAKSDKSGTTIASIMLPFVLESGFPIIGTINFSDYKKYFYNNESLRQSFETVEVSPASAENTLKILKTQIPLLEDNFKLYITFPALTTAIELSQRYIAQRRLPDSAVRTVEGACAWAQAQGLDKLTKDTVAKYVSIQTEIPVEDVTADEATKLMNLESNIKRRVIGQDEAVSKIVEALKRSRTDIRDPNRPIGTFMFLGPTGVGKTHLAKIVSEEFFSNREIITVDMSEYKDISSINKFLGSYENTDIYGQAAVSLLDRVKSNPYCVILFDEMEKAHPQILDLFLQLFDEGRLTSNRGESIDFTHTIIITTSNIGSKMLMDSLHDKSELWDDAKQKAIIELRQAIKPELLNRYDEIVVFAPHTPATLTQITEILLNDLAERLSEKKIKLQWTEAVPGIIANKAYQPEFGARPIKRFIQDNVESIIANKMLTDEIKKGDTVEINGHWFK